MTAFLGHAPYSIGKLAFEVDDLTGNVTSKDVLALADDPTKDLAAYFAENPGAPGAAAFANGYPRHDGGPASSGHFGG